MHVFYLNYLDSFLPRQLLASFKNISPRFFCFHKRKIKLNFFTTLAKTHRVILMLIWTLYFLFTISRPPLNMKWHNVQRRITTTRYTSLQKICSRIGGNYTINNIIVSLLTRRLSLHQAMPVLNNLARCWLSCWFPYLRVIAENEVPSWNEIEKKLKVINHVFSDTALLYLLYNYYY